MYDNIYTYLEFYVIIEDAVLTYQTHGLGGNHGGGGGGGRGGALEENLSSSKYKDLKYEASVSPHIDNVYGPQPSSDT